MLAVLLQLYALSLRTAPVAPEEMREEVLHDMSYVQSPDEYPNTRRGVGPEAPTQPAYSEPAAPSYDEVQASEVHAERAAIRRQRTIGRAGQIIYILFGALEALLIIRFALKALGANPEATFTSLIYGLTQVFVVPFQGVFPSPQTSANMIEVATLLAIIVYALIAWLIVSVIDALINRRPERIA
jgi:YGGT family protein